MSKQDTEIVKLNFSSEAQIIYLANSSELERITVRKLLNNMRLVEMEYTVYKDMYDPSAKMSSRWKDSKPEPRVVRIIGETPLVKHLGYERFKEVKHLGAFWHENETYYIIDVGREYVGRPSDQEKALLLLVKNMQTSAAKKWWKSEPRGEWVRLPIIFTSEQLFGTFLGPEGTVLNPVRPIVLAGQYYLCLKAERSKLGEAQRRQIEYRVDKTRGDMHYVGPKGSKSTTPRGRKEPIRPHRYIFLKNSDKRYPEAHDFAIAKGMVMVNRFPFLHDSLYETFIDKTLFVESTLQLPIPPDEITDEVKPTKRYIGSEQHLAKFRENKSL